MGSSNSPDWKGIVEVLSEDARRRSAKKYEIGERHDTPFGSFTRIVRGGEAGCYVTVISPDATGWQRRRARYAMRGIRWAPVPLMPFALTGGEVRALLAWIGGITLAGVFAPWAWLEFIVILLGIVFAFPAVVFPIQWFRNKARLDSVVLYETGEARGPLEDLAGAMRSWADDDHLPDPHYRRLWQLARYTTGSDWKAGAVVAEMVRVLDRARDGEPLDPATAALSAKKLMRAAEEAREEGALGALREIADILSSRERYDNGSLTQMLGDTGIVRDVERIVRQHV
jgi:hypothetical protein